MSEETNNRLFAKIEKLQQDVAKLLAYSEARDKEWERHEDLLRDLTERVRQLEQAGSGINSGVSTIAWLATFGVALWGVLK